MKEEALLIISSGRISCSALPLRSQQRCQYNRGLVEIKWKASKRESATDSQLRSWERRPAPISFLRSAPLMRSSSGKTGIHRVLMKELPLPSTRILELVLTKPSSVTNQKTCNKDEEKTLRVGTCS